jgi:nucleotide-binding universal stress UspA family protein
MVGFLGARGARPLNEIALDAAQEQTKELLAGLSEEQQKLITPYHRFGDPADTLVHFAQAHHADLVVLGSSGQSRLTKYILGGVANKVLRRTQQAVICVPSDRARPFTKVLMATDFSECSRAALEFAWKLTRVYDAAIEVLHVTSRAWNFPEDLSVGIPDDHQNWFELLRREAEAEQKKFVGAAVTAGVQVNGTVVEAGSPAHTILDYAERSGADVIALGTHGRSGVARLMLGSVAEAVVHHAKVPVLTVRG